MQPTKHIEAKMRDYTENPWKTLKSETVYESPWIKITKHDVINPAGNETIYSTVHFKNLAIGIIPLDEEYNTWIVGQYRYPTCKYSWEIPEGGGDRNVPPLESAQRELSEETGIIAKKWTKILEMDLSNSVTDEEVVIFVAQNLSFEDSHPEESEQLVVRKIPFQELYQMVEEGEVTDSLTVATVLKVKLLMLEGKL